jgi:uncharacterized protein (DUF2267 family)
MKYDQMVKELRDRAEIEDRDDAERTIGVVVQGLCDRLTGDECEDLLAQLPEPLKSSIVVGDAAVQMTARDFVEWVASELEITREEATQRIRAAFDVLQDAVTPGEFHDVLVQLPSGFAELVPALADRQA